MKIDRYIKDLSDKLHNVTNNGNDTIDNEIEKDDTYYLDRGEEPPRFLYYRHIRAKQWQAQGHDPYSSKGPYDHRITEDELDFILKRELRPSPEQRYQDEKRNFLFHDKSCYMRGLLENEYGCTGAGCILECRYFGDYGRIEDEEVIEKHNKFVMDCKQELTWQWKSALEDKKPQQ